MRTITKLGHGLSSIAGIAIPIVVSLMVSVACAGELDPSVNFGKPGSLPVKSANEASASTATISADIFDGADFSSMNSDEFVNERTATALENVSQQRPRSLRGAKEAQIYRSYARAVVLIVTEGGLGSGVLIDKSGLIVTNFHVVGKYKQVGVIFKPKTEGQAVQKADLRRANVLRVDEIADLALIKVAEVPLGVEPMQLGELTDVAVGSDVHAIGHPTGEAWTYTKGFVSQIRGDYKWKTDKGGIEHRASVIQTQTPISPGNSGGPLISDNGRVVGINSFKATGEALNFAVAVNDVKRLMDSSQSRYAAVSEARSSKTNVNTACKPRLLEQFDSKDRSAQVSIIDGFCDGRRSVLFWKPYDIREAIWMEVYDAKTGKASGRYVDIDRDGKWDVSVWDSKGQGRWDVVCKQANGTLELERCEPYKDKG